MISVTISFGPGNSLTREFNDGYTVGCLKNDANIRAALGYGNNVRFLVGGAPQGDHVTLHDGDEVTVETNVGQKAA